MRLIEDILNFRGDVSPFLVHLTRSRGNQSARDVLRTIIESKRVLPGPNPVSDIRFGGRGLQVNQLQRFFGATCLTETPLGEVNSLLEIQSRQINLEPFGLVFLKDRLTIQNVGPVMYINNQSGDRDDVARALFGLQDTNPYVAEKILPLFAVFGRRLTAPGAAQQVASVDFRWEREWRQPYCFGGINFTEEDVFVGLCKDEDIEEFERLFPTVKFIDPMRPMKWYAASLIDARQRLNLKTSVV